MKTLKDYQNQINKCSICGKCQEVCPVYKITGNECAVSKGKFIMLKGVLNGDLKLNKTINKYLDMCLKCGKCKDYCPSGIDVCEIFNIAKSEYVKETLYGKITKYIQSNLYNKILNLGKIFYRRKFKKAGSTKLLYFKGCVNALFPKCENSLKKILKNYDVELIKKDFDCCGMPFLSSGNLERYEQAKTKNSELLKTSHDYVITDCASCESTINSYDNDINAINIGHFLAIQNKKFIFKKHLKVTFHKPCHLKSDAFLKPLLAKCENIEYIEAKNYNECCGFAGEFALRNPKLSLKMTREKSKTLVETNADIVITTCPSCIIGIKQGMIGMKQLKVMNLIEFLAMADKIE